MLDYKDIITKYYALGMSGTKIAESLKVSKSGVNDFLKAFREYPVLSYPLPGGITNYGKVLSPMQEKWYKTRKKTGTDNAVKMYIPAFLIPSGILLVAST